MIHGKPRSTANAARSCPRLAALALAVAGAALEHKALNVEIIDVRGKVDYSDYVIVMSGRSDRQVAALARNIEETLKARGLRCTGVEGLPRAQVEARVKSALQWLADKPQHNRITTELELVELNLKNLK